jgi:hypothetical protein
LLKKKIINLNLLLHPHLDLDHVEFKYILKFFILSTNMSHSEYTPSKKDLFGSEKPFRLGLFASSGSGKSHLIS